MQMMSNVDGHSWALSAIDEERPSRGSSPLNRELIPLTDSPVVVQQHNIPQQKFVLLSAKVIFKERSTVPVCSRYRSVALILAQSLQAFRPCHLQVISKMV